MKTHNRIRSLLPLFVLIYLAAFTSCEKYADGPEIEWMSGTYITYNYRSGVLSGFTANIKFEVIDNTSGEIEMTAEYEGQGKSCTGFVEPGKEYKVVVVCGITATEKDSHVIVDCPTVSEPYKISVDVKTGVSSISIQEL